MTEISFSSKNLKNSEEDSVASNISDSQAKKTTKNFIDTSNNLIIDTNPAKLYIAKGAASTPESETEIKLQSFSLRDQPDLNRQYSIKSNSAGDRPFTAPENGINNKFNNISNTNFPSRNDAPSANHVANTMSTFSISSDSPNKILKNTNENFYQSQAISSNAFLSSQSSLTSLYVLKIQNVPSDLTARETHILFALMIDCAPRSIEILQDGSEKFIKATIPDLKTAIQTAITLDSKKNLFGPYFPFKSFIQLFNNQNMQQIAFNDPSFNVATGEFSQNHSNSSNFGFVDPFTKSNSQIDDARITSSDGGNIWYNNGNSTVVQSRDNSVYLRSPLIDKPMDFRSQMDMDYLNYNSNRPNSAIKMDMFSPPNTASSSSSQIYATNMNSNSNNIKSHSPSIVGDMSLNHLRKASLAMTTSSYDTDPRMSISAGSFDGSISRLQNYILSCDHLRNLPVIFASIPGITEEDIDLLAKVPPPANPADQNSPCNTLYVGNLPLESTEQDMRALFQSQQGFSRLSFRNKPNMNGNNNHGPMCFVEFEQILYAARALANLYGAQIPSKTITQLSQNSDGGVTNVNKLMGIRLSFSKNPLGVRNTQTTMAHLQQQALNANNHSNTLNHNGGIYHSNTMNARRSIALPSNNISNISSLQSSDVQMKSFNPTSANGSINSQNKYNQFR
ncbi:hypothetical protein QEN19_000782 [Hanseniaspora menglaensis]